MTRLDTARQAAHDAAYAILTEAGVTDETINRQAADRIVDALLSVRGRSGLGWLRGMVATDRQIEIRRMVDEGTNLSLLTGNWPMQRATVAAATALVANLGRQSAARIANPS